MPRDSYVTSGACIAGDFEGLKWLVGEMQCELDERYCLHKLVLFYWSLILVLAGSLLLQSLMTQRCLFIIDVQCTIATHSCSSKAALYTISH
jgi:hypothetical protein